MRLSRIITANNRAEILKTVEAVPLGARIELTDAPRTNPQNRLLWSLLNAFADQVEHCGRKYDGEAWKCIFMRALGKQVEFAPSLDGNGIVALGYRSSELSKDEMSNLIDFIYSEGAVRAVRFHDEDAA
jgi:hypothetical protein